MSKRFSMLSAQLNAVMLLSAAGDPTAGVAAPVGSKYWRSGTAGDYTKTGAGDTQWTIVPRGIYFNVKDYGAAGDGVTDDRATIQLAIDDAAVAGGTVFFPPGNYLCGKDGANPYSFVIDNVDNLRFLGCGWGGSTLTQDGDAGAGAYNLFRIINGSDTTEFELLTFDQSGLSNPGADQCHLINVMEASIVKIVNCKFTGGVANAGAYIHTGGTVGDVATLVMIDGCDLRDAGGPCVWFDGGTTMSWLSDSTLIQTNTEPDTLLFSDTTGDDVVDVKVQGCHIENQTNYAVRGTIAAGGVLRRIQIQSSLVLGFVKFDNLQRSQLQTLEVYASETGNSDAVVRIEDSTDIQIQKSILGREAATDAGLVLELDGCTRTQLQGNLWIQEETSQGILHILDCTTTQLSKNVGRSTDAGASVASAYLIEAAANIDNTQINGDMIAADAGTWTNAVHVLSSGGNVGIVQVIPGIFDNCATGVNFDDGGGGAAVFTGLLMVAGGIIDATTDAFSVSVAGVYVRIGGNASTFGANWIAGNGDPENAVTARIGSIYQRLDGGAATTLYVKESGTGDTGWAAK